MENVNKQQNLQIMLKLFIRANSKTFGNFKKMMATSNSTRSRKIETGFKMYKKN